MVVVKKGWVGHSVEEVEVARRWWRLPVGCGLPLSGGGSYRLVYPGCAGGPAGPDVRDAVLCAEGVEGERVKRYVGDVEFHVRVSDWRGHGHDRDVRYNGVILHVVLVCDDPAGTRRQDGWMVPVCSLRDVPDEVWTAASGWSGGEWPCVEVVRSWSEEERGRFFERAGVLRFEQKRDAFVERLHLAVPSSAYSSYDMCLIPALAEGLAYGRDREFFRAVGLRLLQVEVEVPEPLGRGVMPAPLDKERLHVLMRLMRTWGSKGVWKVLYGVLSGGGSCEEVLRALRGAFCELGLSLARSDILICNVVLPFAAAVAALEHDGRLGERAREVYLVHPGLPSNWITRMMRGQLRLAQEPRGACRQQGLHYIYQQTCREKCRNVCVLGKDDI